MSDANHKLTLFFTPEFGDPVWAGIDYELTAPGPPQGEWVLGRSPTAQITLNLRTISVKHAVISYSFANDCWLLADLASQNGTHLNGKKLDPPHRPTPIKIGDRIDLGPRARIQVVENGQDTLSDELKFGPPTIVATSPIETPAAALAPAPAPAAALAPAPAPASKTPWDSLYLFAQWVISGQTPAGKVYRLIVAGALVAALILMMDWLT